MKKRVALLFLISIFTACTYIEEKKEDEELILSEYVVDEMDGIYIDDIFASSTDLSFCFINNSGYDIGLSSWYDIEIKKDNQWYSCSELSSEYRVWLDGLLQINSGHKVIRDYEWMEYYGNLSSGNYRIIFEVFIIDDYQISDPRLIEVQFYVK